MRGRWDLLPAASVKMGETHLPFLAPQLAEQAQSNQPLIVSRVSSLSPEEWEFLTRNRCLQRQPGARESKILPLHWIWMGAGCLSVPPACGNLLSPAGFIWGWRRRARWVPWAVYIASPDAVRQLLFPYRAHFPGGDPEA